MNHLSTIKERLDDVASDLHWLQRHPEDIELRRQIESESSSLFEDAAKSSIPSVDQHKICSSAFRINEKSLNILRPEFVYKIDNFLSFFKLPSHTQEAA